MSQETSRRLAERLRNDKEEFLPDNTVGGIINQFIWNAQEKGYIDYNYEGQYIRRRLEEFAQESTIEDQVMISRKAATDLLDNVMRSSSHLDEAKLLLIQVYNEWSPERTAAGHRVPNLPF